MTLATPLNPMTQLLGIVPSMNTPFLDDGRIDLDGVERAVDAVIDAGVAGMLILAVAAETGSLSLPEKQAVASATLRRVARRVPVIMGCSAAQQEERVALAAMARALGAPAMLCQAPQGLRGAALVEALQEIAEAGPPVLMLQDLDFAGPGLPMEDILRLREQVPAFQCLKIEVTLPGPKYSAVLEATAGSLHVSGGWAASQMMEALHRGVHAFIPTAMDAVYVAIHRLFTTGHHAEARALHGRLAPILAFSNQHLDVSIRFFKHLRQREGLFATARCRDGVRPLDTYQMRELQACIEQVLALQQDVKAMA